MREYPAAPTRSPVPRGFPWLVGLLAVAAACYPSSVSSVSDFNTVTTVYDTAFNAGGGFQALTTYALPGATVANPENCVIEDVGDGGTFFPPDSGFSPLLPTTICTTVVDELNQLGYTLVDPPTGPAEPQPSFVVTITGLSRRYTAWVVYPWCGYWGWWFPGSPWCGGWGVSYPWGGVVGFNFNVGTLVITMEKPTPSASLPDGGSIDAVWSGALNGVITSTNASPSSVATGIQQAFNQSPYLGRPQ